MIKDLRFIKVLQIIFVFCLVLAGLLLQTPHAFAEEGAIGAYPTKYDPDNPKTKSWFIYELKPGTTKEDSITVVNNSNREVKVKIYPVDATTTNDGAFALLNEDQPQKEVGQWVKLSKSIITIAPNDHEDVPFTISIPKEATVGDHPGGIIIQEVKEQAAAGKGMSVTIVSRVGTRIYETVPGAQVVNLDVRDLAYKIVDHHLVFTFTMENLGNIILTPTGTLVVKDSSGKEFDKITLGTLGSVFPGKPTTITVKSTKDAPLFGSYTATVSINYSSLKTIEKSLKFFIYIGDYNVALPIIGVILLIILFVLIKKIFFHKHRMRYLSQRSLESSYDDMPQPRRAAVVPAVYHERTHSTSQSYETMPTQNVDAIFLAHHVKLIVMLVLMSILVLSALFATLFQFLVVPNIMLRSPLNFFSQAPTPTVEVTQTAPTVTPSAVPVSKADMQVIVLNGSGVAGAAKFVADSLTKAGFTVTKTGNASEAATQTTIQYPKGKVDGADQLKESLKAKYTDIKEVESGDSTFTITLGQ